MKKYDYIGKASEGLIRVKIGTFPNFACGYINELGKEVIPLVYTGAKDFHEGLAAVKIGDWSMGKWGFINTQGKLVIPYLFDTPRPFSCGLAKVVYNNEWCFIDMQGNIVISLKKYDGSSSFHNDYAIVSKNHKSWEQTTFGIISKAGVEVIPCKEKCYKTRNFFWCKSLAESVIKYNEAKKLKANG